MCFFSFLYGEIFQTKHFNEIHSHLIPDTLVILDIDDTLLVPVQMLGCDEWFQSRLQHHKKLGATAIDSLEKSLAEWEAIRHLTQVEIVEPGTPEIIQKLQDQKIAVIGLTTQGLALATRTRLQLLDLNIDLSTSSPFYGDYYQLVDGHGILFRSGILFTSGTHKGKCLFGLLDKMHYHPKRIVFINDKESHLTSLEESAKQRGVEFIGLRYSPYAGVNCSRIFFNS